MQLPSQLREAIEQELAGGVPSAPVSGVLGRNGARLQAASARLSERYRQAEGGPHLPSVGKCGIAGSEAMSDDLDRAAYLAVRMPATFAAVSSALRWTREALPQEDLQIRSMLDLGSGPGTALWAAAQLFPTLVSATAVERDPRLIEIGRRLADRSPHAAVREATWLCGDLTAQLPLPQRAKTGLAGDPDGSWDLVVCAYALNEIGARHRAELIRQAWARCAKLLVIVEPGTKMGFANVLAARSQMLSPQHADPDDVPLLVAPCPNSLACPMAGGKDWCHFAARVERTAAHRRLKQATLGHEDEKFSYVAFLRDEPRSSSRIGVPESPPAARIVRHPRLFSGYAQLTLCRAGEIASTTVTRSQKEDWRRLKRLGWGDRW